VNKDDFDTEAMARAIYEHEGFAMDYVPDWNLLRPETKTRLIGEAGALIGRYLARRDEKTVASK